MQNFTFENATKILFGKGREHEVGTETRKYSNKILLHYGQESIKKIGLYDSVVTSLQQANIEYIELCGVQPNPRLDLVKEGIKICRENNIDFILAVGGGSVIDSAKAIAIGVPYPGDVWDFFSDKAQIQQTLPVGVILTIPAAGSESSHSLVITNEKGDLKRGTGSILCRPKFAILNPEITYTLPAHQTVYGASDIMAHVMERYFTNEPHVDLTDRLCEATLKTVINNLPLVLGNPQDYNARAEIMWAGTVAHNGLLGTGRIEDWATHGIEHEISGIYDVAHGAGLSILFPAWMKYVYKTNTSRFAQFAVRVWDVEYCFEDPERTALEGIEKLIQFYKSVGLPTSLKELGIPDDRFEEMAEKAVGHKERGNFKKLAKKDIVEIYKLAK